MSQDYLLLPISSQGLTTATVSSWVHLILTSNLSRKFKTLLQDSFSWHPTPPLNTSPRKNNKNNNNKNNSRDYNFLPTPLHKMIPFSWNHVRERDTLQQGPQKLSDLIWKKREQVCEIFLKHNDYETPGTQSERSVPLNTVKQSFHNTLWLIIIPYQTKFNSKRNRSS